MSAKLILHIGAHKTATTTIQRVLAKNRTSLAKYGVWYPAYSELFPSMSDHYAHLDVAKGLMGDSKRFTLEKVEKFFAKLRAGADEMAGIEAVLISAEPFYRGKIAGSGNYWDQRQRYIERLERIVPFDDVEVVLVVRRQDNYLESLYNEHVKVTRYSKDIWTFFQDYKSRFEYKKQIEAWTRYFPAFDVLTFEDLVASGNVTHEFLAAATGRRDIVFDGAVTERNVSLPFDLTEFKRLLNSTPLSRAELGDVVDTLSAVAAARDSRGGGGRRLSAEDRRNVMAEFAADNDWINDTYFDSRSQGLFPASIGDDDVATELDTQTVADIAAEVIKRHLPEPR